MAIPSHRTESWPLASAIGLAGVAFWLVAGGLTGGVLLRGADGPELVPTAPSATPLSLVRTSFGAVAVEQVERRVRPLAAGAPHRPRHDRAEVQVWVSVRNNLARPVLFSPGQLRLRAGGRSTTITALKTSIQPLALQPRQTVLASLSYLAPRRASSFALELQDVARAQPIRIQLDRVRASAGAVAVDEGGHHK